MGLMDGFWFWIGKALAEVVMWLCVVGLIGIVVGFCLWLQERDLAKWKKAREQGLRDAANGNSKEG